nr:hypothetical protein [Bacteroidota bacterium]
MRKFIFSWGVCLIIFLHQIATAGIEVKNIGIPRVKNYQTTAIPAGPQTWAIDIGRSGFAYFANNDGVLEFDGMNWRNFPLPSGAVVRSILAAGDGKIYAGGYNEFGYFEANASGQLTFHSLQGSIDERLRDFDEVWRIYDILEGIVFQSFNQIMILKDDRVDVITAPESFQFSFIINGELYIEDKSKGLFRLANNTLIKVPGTDMLNGQLISALLPKNDHLLIATSGRNIYEFDGQKLKPWKNEASVILNRAQVYCGLSINKETYAFGTVQEGLLICDTAGRIIQHINFKNGLQNNTILSIQLDQYSNLWLGLDSGIDYVEINSPLTYFSFFSGLSAGYTAELHEGTLYFGTSRGLFYLPWDELQTGCSTQQFKLIPGTEGQVWALQVIDGDLFCGHNSGAFIVEGNEAELLSDIQGVWNFIKPNGTENILISGTYNGFVKYEKKNGVWTVGEKVDGFNESSRFLVSESKNKMWMSHGYKGVFNIEFNEVFDSVINIDFYNIQTGLPSNKGINVFEFQGKPIFTTNNGIYSYNRKNNRFVPDEEMNALFSGYNVEALREDKDGNIWFFTDNDVGVFRLQEDGNYTDVNLPFRELFGKFIKEFQFVFPMDNENVFFGSQNGFIHYMPGYPKNYQQPFQSAIRNISISGADSVIYNGDSPQAELIPELPFRYNQLQFIFSANDFENPQDIKFSTYLEGFEEEWTPWQSHTMREFTNLWHGEYRFHVKALNLYGVETESVSFGFKILRPFYVSWQAYLLYLLLVFLILFFIIKYFRYRIEKANIEEKAKQQKEFIEREKQLQNEALKSEKEVIRLRNEKLRAEMKQKDKELANSTMQMIQKNKSLISIKKSLHKLSGEIGDDIISNHINSLIRKINRDIDNKSQWDVFESHFESVHEEFLKRLIARYPDLSPRELKLCAYLRLNVSSKEIATLMNISTRGVEISRYRLRKKLDLDRNANLTEFIMTF